MENDINIENKITLSFKKIKNSMTKDEIRDRIKNELILNNYNEYQIHYAIERIEKNINEKDIMVKDNAIEQKEKSLKMISQWQALGAILFLSSIGAPFIKDLKDLPFLIRLIFIIFGLVLIIAGNRDKKKIEL